MSHLMRSPSRSPAVLGLYSVKVANNNAPEERESLFGKDEPEPHPHLKLITNKGLALSDLKIIRSIPSSSQVKTRLNVFPALNPEA